MIHCNVIKIPRFIIAGLLICSAYPALSLPSDRSQPFSTNADTVELNDKTGTTTLEGNVIIEQGSMIIKANKVVLHYNANAITKVTASGKPAHYSQVPRIGEEPVEAKANKLEYNIQNENLKLIENASLVQEGGTSLSGNTINYDVQKSVVQAGSDLRDTRGKRVKLVIPASALNKDDDQPKNMVSNTTEQDQAANEKAPNKAPLNPNTDNETK